MKQDYTKILTDILGNLAHLNHIQPSEIPHINLYMDQVTGFMEEHLSNSKRFEDDKILSKDHDQQLCQKQNCCLRRRKNVTPRSTCIC